MIYLFTAFYDEAQPFIMQFHLKKLSGRIRFQQFFSEAAQILLTITGTGGIAAAAAVGSVCTERPPGPYDFLLNIGICAGTQAQGSGFLIHKLTERETGRTFYPDMLYCHGFEEAELVTGMIPKRRSIEKGCCQRQEDPDSVDACMEKDCCQRLEDTDSVDACLYDMEGTALYQAGAYYFAPHQMLFFKIVSDNGDTEGLTHAAVRRLAGLYVKPAAALIESLLQLAQDAQGAADLCKEAQEQGEPWVYQLGRDLHCSKTMEHTLDQLLRYAALTGVDAEAAVRRLYEERRLPCKDKREGKQCFEELKRQLL